MEAVVEEGVVEEGVVEEAVVVEAVVEVQAEVWVAAVAQGAWVSDN